MIKIDDSKPVSDRRIPVDLSRQRRRLLVGSPIQIESEHCLILGSGAVRLSWLLGPFCFSVFL